MPPPGCRSRSARSARPPGSTGGEAKAFWMHLGQLQPGRLQMPRAVDNVQTVLLPLQRQVVQLAAPVALAAGGVLAVCDAGGATLRLCLRLEGVLHVLKAVTSCSPLCQSAVDALPRRNTAA